MTENKKCPKCDKNTLEYNPKWDEEFDRLDRTYPSFDMIHNKLRNDGIPKLKCSNCGYKEYS